jgi:hemerythrin-like domain-containing protein
MQRSQALAPLSRDHHHALAIARRLTRATAGDAAQVAQAFVEFLIGHELSHFALEEAVLLPAVETTAEGGRLGAQMVDQHAQLCHDLRGLQAAAGPPEPTELREIGQRLREHVLLEERELFPYLEQTLSDAELTALGSELVAQAHQD